LAFGTWVVFEVKGGSRERRALHLVICEAKRRAHWHLPPSHGVSFNGDRSFQWEDRDHLGFEILELGVFGMFSLK
jgi:hypothetical protein